MSWPIYKVDDLSQFTGLPASSFSAFSEEALAQASFLFKVATQLSDAPTDADAIQLMKYGMLDMADGIYLGQKFRAQRAAPFQSETIGSYSYSLATIRDKAIAGLPTGVSWFDTAVAQLSVSTLTSISTDSITVFENDYPVEVDANGHRYLVHGWEAAYRAHLHAYLQDPTVVISSN